MQSEFQKIFQEIQADPDNESFTKQGIKPLYYASSSARINIIGQAPGRIAQEKMKFWDDPDAETRHYRWYRPRSNNELLFGNH
ncbi:hypothetical protein [Lactobacillus acetotolerans]|jgi:uracil-DNA glycosylase|uniref:hypothetical protein n=1 Tax=Lactobacillus acetotolerans TaxID=1600 RepID=UPI001F49E269|nr:hypothetical protein [Lactobacillus acetotolerans]